jgi:hypothetical protein
MSQQVEDGTYVEHPEGVVEGSVTGRNSGEDFIALEEACKERALAQLAEETVDLSERPVWCSKLDGSPRKYEAARTHSTSFPMGARSSSATV